MVETAFLTPYERGVRADSQAAIVSGAREEARLRALWLDVQWGVRSLPPEQRDRLRQFVVGRAEIVAGDRLVLRTLTAHARQRQRFALGLPLVLGGSVLALAAIRAFRRGRAPAPAVPARPRG